MGKKSDMRFEVPAYGFFLPWLSLGLAVRPDNTFLAELFYKVTAAIITQCMHILSEYIPFAASEVSRVVYTQLAEAHVIDSNMGVCRLWS